MKVFFCTLGCKVNQYDSEAMLEKFIQAGYKQAQSVKQADIFVVNTCTVTNTGDKKSLQMARKFKRQNPNGELILAGCLTQRLGKELLDTGARLIIGNQQRADVVKLFEQALSEKKSIVAVENLDNAKYENMSIKSHQGHTRAVVKIQEGCNCKCTYCIIPSVRGNIRSRDLRDIKNEAQALADNGFKELVLTGIHLTSYGRDLPGKPSLSDAIWVTQLPEGIKRIRLGSLEPAVINDEFVEKVKKMDKLCPQFHLALQSGSDTVLARMKRRYNTTQYEKAAKKIYDAFPNASITTDIIVGFPGETEEEFMETIEFVKRIGFLKIHVFPYSKREGTPASVMENQISEQIKAQRVKTLMQVANEVSKQYTLNMLGTIEDVLLEEKNSDGFYTGFTKQYVKVECNSRLAGEIVPIKLSKLTNKGVYGEIVE